MPIQTLAPSSTYRLRFYTVATVAVAVADAVTAIAGGLTIEYGNGWWRDDSGLSHGPEDSAVIETVTLGGHYRRIASAIKAEANRQGETAILVTAEAVALATIYTAGASVAEPIGWGK